MSARAAARVGWAAFAVSAAGGAAAGALIALRASDPVPDFAEPGAQELAVGLSALLGFGLFGALIAARHPRNPIGWLFCAAGLAASLQGLSTEYAIRALILDPGALPAGEAMAWLSSWAWVLVVPMPGTVILLLFPTGRLLSSRWRPVLWLSVAMLAGLIAWAGFTAGELEGFPIENPIGLLPEGLDWVVVPVMPAVALSFASVVVRYRRAVGEEAQQLRWMAAAAVFYLVAMALEFALDGITGNTYGLPLLATAAVIAAAGVAVLKYRLYDLNLVVNRALVYGALTVLVVAGYVGLVTGLGAVLDSSGLGVSLAATGVVAVLIQPLRLILQRRVDRLMYGDRDDPYRALARLGERLGQALDPDSVLPAIVETVAEGLRLPYVAIELEEGGARRVAASNGESRGGELVRLPLEYRGERVGGLIVSPRPGSTALTPADLRLLEDLARQAGVAAHAVRLRQDLVRSRERLVVTREEERRRLRRDLHDGLGPTLAGIGLEIESARGLASRDPGEADALLGRLKGEVQEAIADIRRIAYDLRPPTLDELGLVPAVREQAARLGAGGNGSAAPRPRVSVEVPEELPSLPAAVEVAAYRIALEALNNVSRHAGASECTVRITVNGQLELEVRDDGGGFAAGTGSGVGLSSMRERAEELGGTLVVRAGDGGGTVIQARLPMETG